MEDETIVIKLRITGDGSKLLFEHIEQVLADGVETYGIITKYDFEELKEE